MNNFLNKYQDHWLLILRLSVAGFMLVHGTGKMMSLISGDTSFADPIGIGETASLVLVVFAEFICSILIGIGLMTRWAIIPLIITMLVAAFITHASDPFGNKEKALMYILIYGSILIFGAGKFSLDALIKRRKNND